MKLGELVKGLVVVRMSGDPSTEVTSIEHDSRRVRPGALFMAVRGLTNDGNTFIPDAVRKGASAVLTDEQSVAEHTAPVVYVPDSRKAMAIVADRFYGSPQNSLVMTAVTGTNGKTTTTYMVKSIFDTGGIGCGLIGTIRHIVGNETVQPVNTTPEAADIHAFLARMAAKGQSACIMEVSSHALVLSRVYGIRFRAVAFTNLTRDHLDFHGTMEAYFAEKRKLFDGWGAPPPAWCVLNLDDPTWHSLQAVQGPSKVLTYGLGASAEVRPDERKPTPDGGRFTILTPWGPIESRSPLLGRPNAYNVLAATAAALSLPVELRSIEVGLAALENVPGRFERVKAGQPFLVAVDYAHTDDALRNLLATARGLLAPGARVITVFGCGGDRDRAKRPLMGEAAGSMSDLVVLTSDNPRSEDPQAIINDALPGLKKTGARYHLEPDRRKAIELAIGEARANDIVLIAGKGHEDYQVIGTQKLHFDDREVACEVLTSLGYGDRL